MKPTNTVHSLEPKLQAIIQGYKSLPSEHPPFVFHTQPLFAHEVVIRVQKVLDTFEAVRTTRAAHEEALERCKQSIPDGQAFYEEAKAVAKKHFGSDPKMMSRFGDCSSSKPRKRRGACEGEVVEEVTTTVIEQVTESESTSSCGGEHRGCDCGESKPPRCARKPPCAKKKPPKGRRGC